jgi:hypothetical protein
MTSQHVYEIRPRSDKRGVDLISDALPFGRLWYGGSNAISNAVGSPSFTAVLPAACAGKRLFLFCHLRD